MRALSQSTSLPMSSEYWKSLLVMNSLMIQSPMSALCEAMLMKMGSIIPALISTS